MIALQSTTGCWDSKSLQVFAIFFAGGAEDRDVRSALNTLGLNQPDIVYVTLLAIYLLQEAFGDREDEWTLLSKKATTWLKNAGIAKPQQLINKFALQLV